MSSPEQIQQEIERTRENLRTDVDRVTEKVSPGRVAARRVDRVRNGVASVRERVMGALPEPDRIKEAASSVGDSAGGAPHAVRRQTQGSPLAAGVVAFGIGMVLSALVPASEQERRLAAEGEQRAKQPLQHTAGELADSLRQPAQHAVEHVRDTAGQATRRTTEQARSAAEGAREPLQR